MPPDREARSEPLPGYRLIARLGRGGFGEVWKAEAPGGLHKAIKFVYGDITVEEGDSKRASQELKSLSRIKSVRHPFILSMERYDIINGQLIIVMELADRDLGDRLTECRAQGLPGIPRQELLKYMTESAEALDLMNTEYDLQHLDIKPQNIFLVGSHVKVADFGLVKDLEGSSAQITGGVTPIYAPPETFDGWVSRNSDQYSLAIVYQEMLTGVRPFPGPSPRALMIQHLTADPDLTPLPPADRPVVAKALAKDANDRFPSCTLFIEALVKASDGVAPSALTVPAPTVTPGDQLEDVGDDKGEFNASTHLSGPFGKQSGASTTSVRAVNRIDDSSVLLAPDGVLSPSLVVGIGRTGILCLDHLFARLRTVYGTPENFPPIRMLGVDCDTNVLQDIGTGRPVDRMLSEHLIQCRLLKGNQYLQKWDSMKHVAAWLDSGYLFQMTPSQTTGGFRPLGRLAFVDNYRRLLARLRLEINELTNLAKLEATANRVGKTFRRNRPRIYVVAHLGGGTGSGMLIDMCYLLRQILEEAGDKHPDVEGILVTGVGSSDRQRDLRRVNHYAVAQDLLVLSQPDSQFTAKYEPEEEPVQFSGPPMQVAYFFDTTAEHIPEPGAEVIFDSIAELIINQSTTIVGRQYDIQSFQQRWPAFRSLGIFTLNYPQRALFRQVTCRVLPEIIGRWFEPLEHRGQEDLYGTAQEAMEHQIRQPDELLADLHERTNAIIGQPIEDMIEDRLEAVYERLVAADTSEHLNIAHDALLDLKALVGKDPYEEGVQFTTEPLFEEASREASNGIADELLAPGLDLLSAIVDAPGPKLAALQVFWQSIGDLLLRYVDSLKTQNSSAHRVILDQVRDIRSRIASAGKGMLNVPRFIQALRGYLRNKIDYRLREQVLQTFLIARSKLNDRGRDMTSVRHYFEQLLEGIKAEAQVPEDLGSTYTSQTLFPGGYVTLDEAVDAQTNKVLETMIDLIETHLVYKAFEAHKGFWKTTTGQSNVLARDLSRKIVEDVMAWMAGNMPDADTAQCFLDRHRGSEEGEQCRAETRAFFDWAAPSVVGRELAGKPGEPRTVTMTSVFLLGIPETEEGQQMLQLVQNAAIESPPFAFHDPSQVTFIRLLGNTSLGKLLPLWLLKGKTVYESACNTRFTPIVFPQLVNKD